jgi:hypothetical protein
MWLTTRAHVINKIHSGCLEFVDNLQVTCQGELICFASSFCGAEPDERAVQIAKIHVRRTANRSISLYDMNSRLLLPFVPTITKTSDSEQLQTQSELSA